MTIPDGSAPVPRGGFNYGARSLAVALWPNGTLVAGRLPDGSRYSEIKPDGSIVAKLGWWRAVEGQLTIAGERLDAAAPPLRARVSQWIRKQRLPGHRHHLPDHGLLEGRWRLGRASLTFIVLVRKG